jgi:S-adenosylmethionine synthetase
MDSTAYTQNAYKGKMLYCTTLPDAKTVQFAAAFAGMYPTKIPTDSFSSDRPSQDKVEPEIEFSFDMMYTGEQLRRNIQSLVDCTRVGSINAVDDMYVETISVNGECG